MIWQENSKVIVMTTNEVERGRNKCTRYWPAINETFQYNAIHVLTITETVQPHYVFREFLVHKEDEPTDNGGRSIFHYHFKAWPDHGVPQDPGTVLSFLTDINAKQEELTNTEGVGPVIVHCSAGIGRTGTFIVIDILISIMQLQGYETDVDIQRAIQLVRAQRSGMVQTEASYFPS
jgi:tyrosine-protein phosphatase non-receptor type 11